MKTIAATLTLPVAVTRYLDASNRFDASAAADCFAANASVRDENRKHVGRVAIRAWVAETSRKFRPTLTVLRATENGDEVILSVAVSGQFPGSPVTLVYQLRLCGGKILTLTIE